MGDRITADRCAARWRPRCVAGVRLRLRIAAPSLLAVPEHTPHVDGAGWPALERGRPGHLTGGRNYQFRMTNYLAVSIDGPSAVGSYLASIPGVILVWGGLNGVRSRLAALRVGCQLRA